MEASEKYARCIDAVHAQRWRLRGEATGDSWDPNAARRFRYDPRREPDANIEAIASYVQTQDTVIEVGGGAGRVGLGIARSALDSFLKSAPLKSTSNRGRGLLGDSILVQDQVGRAEATLGSARSYLLDSKARVWEQVSEEGRSSPEHGMQIRLAAAHSAVCSRQTVETVWNMAGTFPIYQEHYIRNTISGTRFREEG